MHATQSELSNSKSARCGELTIGELMLDPITRVAMRADGIEVEAFEDMLRSVARRLRADRASMEPVVAIRAESKPKASIFGYSPWPPVDRLGELNKTRSSPDAAPAKALGMICGSHCEW